MVTEDELRVERIDTPLITHPTALTDPKKLDPVDLLFVFVKSQGTAAAIDNAKRLITASTTVVTV